MMFTQEEYDVMLDELCNVEHDAIYEMLFSIVDKFLTPKVKVWCDSNSVLRGRGYEEDIMQVLRIHFYKITLRTHFEAKDSDGNLKYPRVPGVFGKWMETVAKNEFKNYLKSRKIETEREISLEELSETGELAQDDGDKGNAQDELVKAFKIVISSKASIYKILTWLAQSIYVLNYHVGRKEARDILISKFENETLTNMYEVIMEESHCVTWLRFSKEEHEMVLASLRKTSDKGGQYGDVTYKEFFMMNKGEISPKKSVSDWVNRLDYEIKRRW